MTAPPSPCSPPTATTLLSAAQPQTPSATSTTAPLRKADRREAYRYTCASDTGRGRRGARPVSWSRLPMEDDLEGPFGARCYTLTLWEAIDRGF
ncbi:hypothetical protein GCM10018771_68540 [Streptomyces cellulosae]|nr:hypothetical protein GCM10018771_68540 [Streptomyces cellulosae]